MKEYNDFSKWLDRFEKIELLIGDGFFTANSSVAAKVDEQNWFKPFYGDTIVFDLDDVTKSRIIEIIRIFYREVRECFCERIYGDNIHMTLHDLSSSPEFGDVKSEVMENRMNIIQLLKKNPIFPETIRMMTNNISNSMDISLVMALKPVDEIEYEKLMKLYEFFDQVRDLKRPLVPHITLGYYNQYGFDESLVKKLKKLVKELNEQGKFEVILNTEDLAYQFFRSMNNYETIFQLTEV